MLNVHVCVVFDANVADNGLVFERLLEFVDLVRLDGNVGDVLILDCYVDLPEVSPIFVTTFEAHCLDFCHLLRSYCNTERERKRKWQQFHWMRLEHFVHRLWFITSCFNLLSNMNTRTPYASRVPGIIWLKPFVFITSVHISHKPMLTWLEMSWNKSSDSFPIIV